MEKLILRLPILMVAFAVLAFSSCKKEGMKTVTADSNVSAQDNIAVTTAADLSADLAAAGAGDLDKFMATGTATVSPDVLNRLNTFLCGAQITEIDNTKIITFDGSTSCHGIIRSGRITETLSSGRSWQDAGAVITVIWNNLKVTDVATGDYYVLAGTHTLTNVTGGLGWKITAGVITNATVTYRMQGKDMSISYSNGTQGIWSMDKSRAWTSTLIDGGNRIVASSFSTMDGEAVAWGTDRYGLQYTTKIVSPVLGDNDPNCMYQPYKGEITTNYSNNSVLTITYVTDASAGEIASLTVCGTGYKITYTINGVTTTRFVPYTHS